MIFELDPHLGELIADAIRFRKILGRTRLRSRVDESRHPVFIDGGTTGIVSWYACTDINSPRRMS